MRVTNNARRCSAGVTTVMYTRPRSEAPLDDSAAAAALLGVVGHEYGVFVPVHPKAALLRLPLVANFGDRHRSQFLTLKSTAAFVEPHRGGGRTTVSPGTGLWPPF